MKYGAVVDIQTGKILARWSAEADHPYNDVQKFIEATEPPAEGSILDVSKWPQEVVWLEDIEGAREVLLGRLDRERVSRENGGFSFEGKVYSTDPASLQRMAAVEAYITRNGVLPSSPFAWSGTIMDVTKFQAFQDAKVEKGAAVYANYLIHKAAIGALTTREEIDSYDLSAGWPQ